MGPPVVFHQEQAELAGVSIPSRPVLDRTQRRCPRASALAAPVAGRPSRDRRAILGPGITFRCPAAPASTRIRPFARIRSGPPVPARDAGLLSSTRAVPRLDRPPSPSPRMNKRPNRPDHRARDAPWHPATTPRPDGIPHDDHPERRTARRARPPDRGRPAPPPRRQARARRRRAEPRPRPPGPPRPRRSSRATPSRSSPSSAAAVEPLAAEPTEPPPLAIGPHRFRSRLLVGTGKYATLELMRDCLEASGTEVVTVAVRRERLVDREGRSLLDFLDPARYTILPNTAGCFNADDALRTARLGRELLLGPRKPGRRLGQARSPGRHPDPPARPGRHPPGDRDPGRARGSTSSATPATTRSWPAA